MANSPLPVVKAFLVCDLVIQDAQSGKKSLVGLFHEIKASRFPTMHPELWIYANLTDARGAYEFEIRIVDVESGRVLGNGKPPRINIQDPRQTTELSAQLRHVRLPAAGLYEFQLLANDQLAATKAIRVSEHAQPGPPGMPPDTSSGSAERPLADDEDEDPIL